MGTDLDVGDRTQIVKDDQEVLEIEASAKNPAMLILTDRAYSGWQAGTGWKGGANSSSERFHESGKYSSRDRAEQGCLPIRTEKSFPWT